MPIYEYHCSSCEKSFDHLAKSMAQRDEKIACPECGSRKTGRKLSVVAVGSSGSAPAAPAGHTHSGMCGCGRVPGSCGGMN
jgi:putative FmdB family regulatory protein